MKKSVQISPKTNWSRGLYIANSMEH